MGCFWLEFFGPEWGQMVKSCEQGIECTIFKRSRAFSKSVCQMGKINHFCAENPQISGTILQNLMARATWPPGFVHRCGIEPSDSLKCGEILTGSDAVWKCLKKFMFLSQTNALLYYTYKMLKYTVKISHDCSYMFRFGNSEMSILEHNQAKGETVNATVPI